jgi:hypothetical protein
LLQRSGWSWRLQRTLRLRLARLLTPSTPAASHTPDRNLAECEQPVFDIIREAQAIVERNYPALDAGLTACGAHYIGLDDKTWAPVYERGFGACVALGDRYNKLTDQLVAAILRVHHQRDLDAVRRAAGAQ